MIDGNQLAKELQERLVQCCIDFIKEKGDTRLDRVKFTADCLQESSKQGSWQPCTDSTCEIDRQAPPDDIFGGWITMGFSA